tara:strand:+ start:90 stop:410 length:321 start_codon:yes stop_codon:yes gene_type:complete
MKALTKIEVTKMKERIRDLKENLTTVKGILKRDAKEKKELKQKEKIARNFISQHKNHNIDDWLICVSDLESVYYSLIGGVYGDTEDDCVEISGTESRTGNPIIFDL